MFCENCGKLNDDRRIVCEYCGQNIIQELHNEIVSSNEKADTISNQQNDIITNNKAVLQFEGLYVCDTKELGYYSCLRFFSNGIVVSASIGEELSHTSLINVAKWLNSSFETRGVYTISKDGYIHFTSGRVEYSGMLIENRIVFDTFSHINGHQSKNQVYCFTRI